MRQLLLVCLVTGCVPTISSGFARTSTPPHATPPRPAEHVEMFLADWPSRPFVEVGLVEVQEERGTSSSTELLAALRERAGKEGCDGVIFLGDNDAVWSSSSTKNETSSSPDATGSGSTTTNTTTASASSGTRNGYRGSCVVFIDAVTTR